MVKQSVQEDALEQREKHPVEAGDPFSAMTPHFNFFFRWFARRYFRHFQLAPETSQKIRELESQGSVIYIMRYASRLDYFLFNSLFLREGLQLSGFANGLRFYYYRPLSEAIPAGIARLRAWFRGDNHPEEGMRHYLRSMVASGRSAFVFLRTARKGRLDRVEDEQSDINALEEVVREVWDTGRPVFLVPLALFWRKGPRSERRFLNLAYGAPTRPSDLAKVTSFLTTYRSLHVKVGDAIELHRFVDERRQEGAGMIARMVRRVLLIFFYREEKVVEGPTLRPRYKVQETVLSDPHVKEEIARQAKQRGAAIERVHAEAERIFREIAANMNSTFLALLNVVVSSIFKRMFHSIDVVGLSKVAEYAKRHPLILAPSHRSYFDFLILSQLFYSNYLVPPHIASRENMAFGPFGFIFRRAGAFFLRRSFADPLYKTIFRNYVGYLVREGFTQEFFIEGGRSRTGKTLTPRLGMLMWNVETFLQSTRRDLFIVPIAITYERLVEEDSMVYELEGGNKSEESVMGLMRARKLLRRRFGTVVVNFGAPISIADAIGNRRTRLAQQVGSVDAEELRQLVVSLGDRIVEGINWATVANATSVAATALLGSARRGHYRYELEARMQRIVDLLRLQDVRLTPALENDVGEFRDSIASLVLSGLIEVQEDPRGEIVFYRESKRRALDFYRNSIAHYLVTPSFLARGILQGASRTDLLRSVAEWLQLMRQESYMPTGEVLAAHSEAFIDFFERSGFIDQHQEILGASEKGLPYFRFVAMQTQGVLEAYYAVCKVAESLDEELPRKAFLAEAAVQFSKLELLGEVKRLEAANTVTFSNALDLLLRQGVLRRIEARESGGDSLLRRGEDQAALAALLERLAGELFHR